MKVFGETVRTVIKNPFIIVYMAVLLLLVRVIHQFNPIIPLVTGLIDLSNADIFESIISVLQFFLSTEILPISGIIIVGISILVSLASGLLLPGYLNIINNAVSGISNTVSSFFDGYKKHFIKVTFLFFKSLIAFLLLLFFLLVASVPMMIVLRATTIEKPELVLVSMFVVFLTIVIMFFASMFLRIYIMFWITAAVNGNKQAFMVGKKVADKHYWLLLRKFLTFYILFIAFHGALSYLEIMSNVYGFTVGWVFNTIFMAVFITYIFMFYNRCQE